MSVYHLPERFLFTYIIATTRFDCKSCPVQVVIWHWHHTAAMISFLFVSQVGVGNRPVIGLRSQLEGIRSNRLAIHLQHLTFLPKSLPLVNNANAYLACDSYSCNFRF